MVYRIFVCVCVLFACSLLEIVSAHGSGQGGGGGEGAISKLNVTISYETEDFESETFFKKQFTAQVFEEFMKCGVVRFNFMPCTTSSMVNGALACQAGKAQCDADKIHACAATLYKGNQHQLGKFVICHFNCKDAEKCACQNGMKWDTINQCAQKNTGDQYCNAFFDVIINDVQTNLVPAVKFGSKFDSDLSYSAAVDFKKVVCAQLKNNNLKCNACSCS